jgi:hypothetical protein
MFGDPVGVEHRFRHRVRSPLSIRNGKSALDVLTKMHLPASLGIIWGKDCHEGKLILVFLGKRDKGLDKLSSFIMLVEEYLGQRFLILERLVDRQR